MKEINKTVKLSESTALRVTTRAGHDGPVAILALSRGGDNTMAFVDNPEAIDDLIQTLQRAKSYMVATGDEEVPMSVKMALCKTVVETHVRDYIDGHGQRVVEEVVVRRNTYDAQEADRLVEESRAGFRRYMEDR